jgi:hypothetical protein
LKWTTMTLRKKSVNMTGIAEKVNIHYFKFENLSLNLCIAYAGPLNNYFFFN